MQYIALQYNLNFSTQFELLLFRKNLSIFRYRQFSIRKCGVSSIISNWKLGYLLILIRWSLWTVEVIKLDDFNRNSAYCGRHAHRDCTCMDCFLYWTFKIPIQLNSPLHFTDYNQLEVGFVMTGIVTYNLYHNASCNLSHSSNENILQWNHYFLSLTWSIIHLYIVIGLLVVFVCNVVLPKCNIQV